MLAIVLSISIIILTLMLVNYLRPEVISPIPTRALRTTTPTLPSTPTATANATLTPRPTWTPRATSTVTQTIIPTASPTLTRYPTLTKAVPVKENWRYTIKEWSVTDAERLARQIQAKEIYSGLPEVWHPAIAYAQAEALLRYPDALQAAEWEWGMAANLAYTNDPRAAQRYAQLIQDALQAKQVRVDDLPAWFQLYQSDQTLELHTLQSLPGELSRKLIEISGAGGAYLWLLETPSMIQVYPLVSDFDYETGIQTGFLLADLTGDGIDEISILRSETPGQFMVQPPQVFDQAFVPPVQMNIAEQAPFNLAIEFRASLAAVSQETGSRDLELTALVFPACPVSVTYQYHWSGERFEVSTPQLGIVPYDGLEAACQLAVEHAASVWGPQAALTLAEPVLEVWPPEMDLEGNPYPIDALDAWRFRLGIYQALAGKSTDARQTLNELIANPIQVGSVWQVRAEQFLQKYPSPEYLYTACQETPFCNQRSALQTLVTTSEITDPNLMVAFLGQKGVVIRSSGVFDFDADGSNERWITVLPSSHQKLEFWILARLPEGVQPVFVQLIDDNQPRPYYYQPQGEYPIVQFEAKQGFIMHRLPESQQVFLEHLTTQAARPTYIRDEIHRIAQRLLDGVDPAQILKELNALQADKRFRADCLAYYVCGKFMYTLGLTYELLGQSEQAVNTYLYLWRDFPTSPYTVMARMKMIFKPPPPTATNTPTATRTITPTHDPNSTATMTPTVTDTPDPFATPSETPSESETPTRTPTRTPEGYPYP